MGHLYVKEIDDYRVSMLYAGSQTDAGTLTIQLFSTEEYLAVLEFRPAEASEKESHYNDWWKRPPRNKLIPVLMTPRSDFAATVDLLRNERPLYFHFHDEPLAGWIQTGREPVGEEEEELASDTAGA